MSNEIKVSLRTTITNGEYEQRFDVIENYDQAEIGAASGVQIVGTTTEALNYGDVVDEGYLFLRNLDDTNYVSVALDDPSGTGSENLPFAKMKAGEFAVFRVSPGVQIYLEANTANCKVLYLLLED